MTVKGKKTLVLGIGNTILTDEGVGIHVIEYLKNSYPENENVSFIDGGTLSFSLAGLIAEHQQLIVVDAARMGAEPGHVACYEGCAMDRYLTGNRQSVHEVGLTDLLDIARLSEHYPENRALIGIEPANMEWGEKPTSLVAKAIPQAAQIVIEMIDKWSAASD